MPAPWHRDLADLQREGYPIDPPRGPFGGRYPEGWAPAAVVEAMHKAGWRPEEQERNADDEA